MDVFAVLNEWLRLGTPEERRHWALCSYGDGQKLVRCELSWNLKGQCAWKDHVGSTPLEAVVGALAHFPSVEKCTSTHFDKEQQR